MTVLTKRVATGTDDVRQDGSTNDVVNNVNSLYLNAEFNGGASAGIRYDPVDIPQGATINSASITVTFEGTGEDDIDHDISGVDEDDAAAWNIGAGTNDVLGRTRTTATVKWSKASAFADGATEESPDIASIVQEIVNRATRPDTGAAMSFVHVQDGSGTRARVTARDEGSADAALLTADYTAAAATHHPTLTLTGVG